jgi:DNA-binding MarR family transcriptional regulator
MYAVSSCPARNGPASRAIIAVIQRLVDGPGSIGDIAATLGVTQQSVSRSIAELTSGGYITSKQDPADGRRRLQQLTTRGRAAIDVTRRFRAGLVTRLRAQAGDDPVDAAEHALMVLIDLLGATASIQQRAARPAEPI